MMSIEIRAHDRYTLEVLFQVPLDKKNSPSYLELALITASGLKIHPSTFSKEEIKKSWTNYTRYTTPTWSLKEILNTENSLSPLLRLENITATGFLKDRGKKFLDEELRLLASILKSIFLHQVLQNDSTKEVPALIRRLLALFEKMREALPAKETRDRVQPIFGYLFFKLYEALSLREKPNPLLRIILGVLKEEFPRFYPLDEKKHNRLIAWESKIKRHIQGVHFLPLDKSKKRVTSMEFLFGGAAAIAMTVSLGLGFWIMSFFEERTLGFAAGLIGAYVVKDRIKEFFRLLGRKWAQTHLPDEEHWVRDSKKSTHLGWIKDSWGFRPLQKEQQKYFLPQIDPLEEGILSPKPIYWRRTFHILEKRIKAIHQREGGVQNILRINFRPLLIHAAEPKVVKEFFDGKKKIHWKGEKTYPAYLLIEWGEGKEREVHTCRIQLTQKGIVDLIPI